MAKGRDGQREYLEGSLSYHEILIPVVVAAIPCIGLLLSKKFEMASVSRAKIYERLEKLEQRISHNELRFERIIGRLNGLEKHNKHEDENQNET